MQKSIIVRPLSGQDAQSYCTLRLEAVTSFPDSFLSTAAVESKRSILSFQYELSSAAIPPAFGYYGIFLENHLVGYLQLGCSLLPKQHHLAFVYNLYITRNHHREGLAETLINHCLSVLREKTKVERLFVTCNANNHHGVAFYTKLGFIPWGKRPKSVLWQGEYDDEIEWVLELR